MPGDSKEVVYALREVEMVNPVMIKKKKEDS